MQGRERLERLLSEHQVPFEVQFHPWTYSAQAAAQSVHVPGSQVAKVVMVVADGRLVMLVLPAPLQVDLAQFSRVLKAHDVRLAREEEFVRAFPDCETGTMPPFGNLFGVPVYADRALATQSTIVCQAGSHAATIRLSYADWVRLVRPKMGVFTCATLGAHQGKLPQTQRS